MLLTNRKKNSIRKRYSNMIYLAGFPSAIFSVMSIFSMGGGTIISVLISLLLVGAFVMQVFAVKPAKS